MQICLLLQRSDSENSYLKQSSPKVKGGETECQGQEYGQYC